MTMQIELDEGFCTDVAFVAIGLTIIWADVLPILAILIPWYIARTIRSNAPQIHIVGGTFNADPE